MVNQIRYSMPDGIVLNFKRIGVLRGTDIDERFARNEIPVRPACIEIDTPQTRLS
jgi:hypothetical protein